MELQGTWQKHYRTPTEDSTDSEDEPQSKRESGSSWTIPRAIFGVFKSSQNVRFFEGTNHWCLVWMIRQNHLSHSWTETTKPGQTWYSKGPQLLSTPEICRGSLSQLNQQSFRHSFETRIATQSPEIKVEIKTVPSHVTAALDHRLSSRSTVDSDHFLSNQSPKMSYYFLSLL